MISCLVLYRGSDFCQFLRHENNKIFFEDKEVKCPIIYTGPLDELFKYKYGQLSYRSLKFEFLNLNEDKFQNTAVVNYPAHPIMTRITEYKNMTLENHSGTIISKEYPGAFDKKSKDFNVPYYPMPTDNSREQYKKYKNLADNYKNLYPLGRLATYKYLNMDQVIKNALDLFKNMVEK
ncbi:MAG: hypothetical protein HRT99_03230 [Mycoplasmatales bacterium]|nr:hypothetical protein [Mycoplasmatales bacterium]